MAVGDFYNEGPIYITDAIQNHNSPEVEPDTLLTMDEELELMIEYFQSLEGQINNKDTVFSPDGTEFFHKYELDNFDHPEADEESDNEIKIILLL